MSKQPIQTTEAPSAIGPYSQAVQLGDMIYASGQIGLDPETGELVDGLENQTHRVMQNVTAVLKAAGCEINDVVKTLIFMQNMEDFTTVNEIYASYFEEPYPARSAVEVARMPKGALVEVEVIAKKK
ncbi:RidA family protein [Salipaludibacillus agaradhaerens]|uniref:RidA family protein n=1 Tax=Salipaludibacillus agaradhaerens TaxID=76935 RepID=A0A9Q4FZC4_SALAG|nr:RidA family protein [Salipaludibacillus agaradhaerens]UJW59347.1 RidA family protein [Bacillus sp. A116_S68]MCR6098640.1 RidA family protein [Salipaludibacillus agaradhaerens]MCR6108308.1 RidA family protein [Salipaludibacillus agaradhaerens]MCR6115647.1 RidA family protein [Salipaludibacillus agaradhaerens]MCR6120333.1 RidA family protein [Salipaludibacillus agaradhaerens]